MIELTEETVGDVKVGTRVWYRIAGRNRMQTVLRVTPKCIVTDTLGSDELRFRRQAKSASKGIGTPLSGVGYLVGIATFDEIVAWNVEQERKALLRQDAALHHAARGRMRFELQKLFSYGIVDACDADSWEVRFTSLSTEQVRDLASKL
jgi:hypothetical protein